MNIRFSITLLFNFFSFIIPLFSNFFMGFTVLQIFIILFEFFNHFSTINHIAIQRFWYSIDEF
eukprot:jgi/Orpsp1_1/1186751/evm.model.d7180000053026.1